MTKKKLQSLVNNAIEGESNRLINYTQFLKNVSINDDSRHNYQGLMLITSNAGNKIFQDVYKECIANLLSPIEEMFGESLVG